MAAPTSKGHLNPGASGVHFDRFALGPAVAELVRHVWVVRWSVPPGEVRPQRVLSYPAFNAVLQPRGAVLAGPDSRVSVQELRGSSWAVGVLFRPAAATLLTATPASALVGAMEPLPSAPLAAVASAMALPDADAARVRLVGVLHAWLQPFAARVDDRGRLVNTVARLAETDAGILRAAELAERSGLGLRRLERLVREQIGVGPKWLIECRRLQEAAARLRAHPETSLSDLAAELGYADYPHFSRRYARTLGETPETTRASQLSL
jgi:AraC-like DNA-binding protein